MNKRLFTFITILTLIFSINAIHDRYEINPLGHYEVEKTEY